MQQLENKFKVVGSDMLTDLRQIKEPMKRFEYIKAKADQALIPSFFKRKFPTEDQVRRAEEKNACMGDRQPRGSFYMGRYKNEGWCGADLKFMAPALDKPATQEELAAQYLAIRLHLQAAIEAKEWAGKRR